MSCEKTLAPELWNPGLSAHVNPRTLLALPFGPTQHLSGHRSHLAHPEQQELRQVADWVALGPLKVDVGPYTCHLTNVQQYGGDRIGDRRRFNLQHAVLLMPGGPP